MSHFSSFFKGEGAQYELFEKVGGGAVHNPQFSL